MLSYQHAYHAGSRADIHKHDILARALEDLCRDPEGPPITCIETHAGRGIYDLKSDMARKTGEAAQGWLALIKDPAAMRLISPRYRDAVRSLNKGKFTPLYPGSPYIAAQILRPQDKLRLMELHPAEYAALVENMGADPRMQVQKRDGLEGALELSPGGDVPGLVLIDPSYEIKSEYETIPGFAAALHEKWPGAHILIWAPMLPALRHEILTARLRKSFPALTVSEVLWARPEDGRGMYGSLMLGIDPPRPPQAAIKP